MFTEPRPISGFPCRQLVNAGVLTVRDAGSWWLAVPGAGRFIKYFIKGICFCGSVPLPLPDIFWWFLKPLDLTCPPCGPSLYRAPGCPWHGPEGQVPRAAPFGAPGPAGTSRSATRPCLPCARSHRGPVGGLVSFALAPASSR